MTATKKFTVSGVLAEDTDSTSIHGITGREISEGECPAGTEIYNLRHHRTSGFGHPVYRFEVKQGKAYYTEETYGRPKLV